MAKTGYHLAQEFKSLAGDIGGLARYSGDVAAGASQTCHETCPYWVSGPYQYNRDEGGRLLCRDDGRRSIRNDNIDLKANELSRNLGKALATSRCPANLESDFAFFTPTEFAQLLHKSGQPFALSRRCGRAQEADCRQLRRLLRVRRNRPRYRSTNEPNKLPSFHSITSSARARREGGMVRPMALAVLRLTTSSNLVGCCTGSSPGFSPF